MIKKVFLFSIFSFIAACQSYSETSQCDPEKNYIISDPVAMEEYKELRKQGKIKSYYIEKIQAEKCFTSICVFYNKDKFDFIEKYFNDSERNGVYTIKRTENIKDPECIKRDPAMSSSGYEGFCFKVVKNESNKIESDYKYLFDDTNKDFTVIKFINLKNNKVLYEFSYQLYSTAAIGGPGFGTCPLKKINNPAYKFNPYTFHNDKY